MKRKWTVMDVSDRFEEAVFTLRRLPAVRVQGHFNSWPDILRTTAEQLQAMREPLRIGPPTAEAITRLDECLQWVLWLEDEDERFVVWMRAERVNWKTICRKIGYSRSKSWQIYTCALLKIVTRLNVRMMAGLDVYTTKH